MEEERKITAVENKLIHLDLNSKTIRLKRVLYVEKRILLNKILCLDAKAKFSKIANLLSCHR